MSWDDHGKQCVLLMAECKVYIKVQWHSEMWYTSISQLFRNNFLNNCNAYIDILFIPNRTFLVRFGGISGEFGRVIARILAICSQAKIPMARPNKSDMLPKRKKKVWLGIYLYYTQIQPEITKY